MSSPSRRLHSQPTGEVLVISENEEVTPITPGLQALMPLKILPLLENRPAVCYFVAVGERNVTQVYCEEGLT
jgi:hypothetical protein